MRKPLSISAGAVLWMASALFCAAQTASPEGSQRETTTLQQQETISDFNKASYIIGLKVRNSAGENLGDVKDMAVDVTAGKVRYVVLARGGFLGAGEKLMAIPPDAFSPGEDKQHLVLKAGREALQAAITFDRSDWTAMTERWSAESAGPERQLAAGQEIREPAGAERPPKTAQRERHDRAAEYHQRRDKKEIREPSGTQRKVSKATDVLGMTVKSNQGERLGDIQDLALDLQSGEILYVVLASGGFLGIGEKWIAVPPVAFDASQDERVMILNADRQLLAGAQGFDRQNWPGAPDETFAIPIQRFSQRQTLDEPAGARQREPAAATADPGRVTAEEQSRAPDDVRLTRDIRRAIMTEPGLSLRAKNIKIITIDGRVTLRGTVNSDEERQIVEQAARRMAGPANVESHLEVKTEIQQQ